MNQPYCPPCRSLPAVASAPHWVSRDLLVLGLELPENVDFLPGQFAMLNFSGGAQLMFCRPFSLLAASERRVSFLLRVVGGGTSRLAGLAAGDQLNFLGPLGNPFPPPASDQPVLVVAGGVGLPPLRAWWERYSRAGDLGLFGARDGVDVPWDLLPADWLVSVDSSVGLPTGRQAFTGTVVDLWRQHQSVLGADPRLVLACGPLPLLQAATRLAAELTWPCLVSVEEHMGCGYGVCRGCVVPLASGGHATACQAGPVFPAEQVDWQGFVRKPVAAGGHSPSGVQR